MSNRGLSKVFSGIFALFLMMNTAVYAVDTQVKTQTAEIQASAVNSLDLVNTPATYLHKKIVIKAEFDKFSTLGLDYKPAFKDSQKFISILIKRPDVTDRVIPLSELKLFIARDKAEKLIDLAVGDVVEITGTVFSNALDDPWVEVDCVKVLESKTKKS